VETYGVMKDNADKPIFKRQANNTPEKKGSTSYERSNTAKKTKSAERESRGTVM